jgi:putative ABC transport system substrate-binding protein
MPSVGFKDYADAGGLLGFGASFPDAWRRAAGFVDRIFRGARPADLPVEQASRFDRVVNLRTARALGVTIQSSVLLRADTVIDP